MDKEGEVFKVRYEMVGGVNRIMVNDEYDGIYGKSRTLYK